jgi:hypothetical protein
VDNFKQGIQELSPEIAGIITLKKVITHAISGNKQKTISGANPSNLSFVSEAVFLRSMR